METESPSAVDAGRRRAPRRRGACPSSPPSTRDDGASLADDAREHALKARHSERRKPSTAPALPRGVVRGRARMPHEARTARANFVKEVHARATGRGRTPRAARPRRPARRRRSPSRSVATRPALAGELRRDEHEQLVDEIRREERRRQRRASLEQQRLHALLAPARAARPRARRSAARARIPPAAGPRPNASRRGCFGASTPRASSRGASARTVPIPTATASTQPRSSWTRRRDSSPRDPALAGHASSARRA